MGFPNMVIVGTGLRYDSIKRFLNKLSYNEIFKMNSSVWRDIRSRNGSWSRIVGLREGNRVWRVSPDRVQASRYCLNTDVLRPHSGGFQKKNPAYGQTTPPTPVQDSNPGAPLVWKEHTP